MNLLLLLLLLLLFLLLLFLSVVVVVIIIIFVIVSLLTVQYIYMLSEELLLEDSVPPDTLAMVNSLPVPHPLPPATRLRTFAPTATAHL